MRLSPPVEGIETLTSSKKTRGKREVSAVSISRSRLCWLDHPPVQVEHCANTVFGRELPLPPLATTMGR